MEMSVGDLPTLYSTTPGQLLGRKGMQAVALAGSIFVLGGLDSEGGAVCGIQRINCSNGRIDRLVLDHPLPNINFALFAHQETLYIWGGLRLHLASTSPSNTLLSFDGSHFHTPSQKGTIPPPRHNHSYTVFGRKYLIVFGGCDKNGFFKDWYMLNLISLEWTKLRPSIDVGYCISSSMAWINGRGILLTSQNYSPSSSLLLTNKLYQFYVSDFKRGLLHVRPLDTSALSFMAHSPITHLLALDHSSLLLLSLPGKPTEHFAWKFELQSMRYQTVAVRWQWGSVGQWNALLVGSRLYLMGGGEGLVIQIQMWFQKRNYKRNVCGVCRLYYDESWYSSSSEVYTIPFKEDYDYNYAMRMDNRILNKIASTISSPLSALSTLFHSITTLKMQSISFAVHRSKSNPHLDTKQYLKVVARGGNTARLADCFLLRDGDSIKGKDISNKGENTEGEVANEVWEREVIRMKLCLLRLGKAFVITLKGRDGLEVIYMSPEQADCPHSNHMPTTVYYYNTAIKNSPSRHVIATNTQEYLSNSKEEIELVTNTLQILVLGCQQLENQLHVDGSEEEQTNTDNPTQPLPNSKSHSELPSSLPRKSISLLQLCFDPRLSPPSISHSHSQTPLLNINIAEILHKDAEQGILQAQRSPLLHYSQCINRVELYHPPAEYWFRKILIYHRGRMLSHISTKASMLCGVIELKKDTPLDITGTRLLHSKDQQRLKEVLKALTPPKRSHPQ